MKILTPKKTTSSSKVDEVEQDGQKNESSQQP